MDIIRTAFCEKEAETEGRISYETTLIAKVAAIRNQIKCNQHF